MNKSSAGFAGVVPGLARFLAKVVFPGLLLAGVMSVRAAEVAPDELMRSVTSEVMELLRSDAEIRAGDTQKIIRLAEEKVLPHFDFVHMVKLALGREGRKATPEQLQQLAHEFRNLLLRTYSRALTEYLDVNIEYQPLKMAPGETDVRVRSHIIKPGGGKPIRLDYYLEKMADGWKAYDIEIGGISLVTNYRSAFASEIRSTGIDGLIASLRQKNSEGGAEAK